MRIHTGTITNIDRIELSNYLYELADDFTNEAQLWKPTNRAQLERNARHLAQLARGVLSGAAEFGRAEAFADAGTILLKQTRAQRRMIASVLTEPTRGYRS